MKASISEGGSLDAEYYRLDSKGHRVYNGYREWSTFLDINTIRVASRWKHFKACPGRYVAVLRATDESNNTSKPVTRASRTSPRRRRRRAGRASSPSAKPSVVGRLTPYPGASETGRTRRRAERL